MKFVLILLTCVFVAQAKLFDSKKSFQIHFPDNGKISYAKLVGTIDHELHDFTLCHWSRSHIVRDNYRRGVFSYSTEAFADSILTLIRPNQDVHFYQDNVKAQLNNIPVKSSPTEWLHICVTWSMALNSRQIFVNGIKIQNFSDVNKKPTQPNGIVILGQDHDTVGGVFDPDHPLIGQISEVHLWDFILTPNEVEQVFKCEYEEEGNVIGWHRSKWELVNGSAISSVRLPCGQPQ